MPAITMNHYAQHSASSFFHFKNLSFSVFLFRVHYSQVYFTNNFFFKISIPKMDLSDSEEGQSLVTFWGLHVTPGVEFSAIPKADLRVTSVK
jgi:hypothetical protein